MTTSSNKTDNQTGDRDPLVLRLMQRIKQNARNGGQHVRMDVNVKRRGEWFVLKGRVSSHRLKSKLFSWVPKIRGEQRIIDKLQVRSAPDKESR